MRAILVSVNYSDLLAITLPWNRHHFSEVMVVTSLEDEKNVRPICDANNAKVFATDAFFDDGAVFNKFKALEQALDAYGRYGWLCNMDADVLWPRSLPGMLMSPIAKTGQRFTWQEFGNIYTPVRRMWNPLPIPFTADMVPSESIWAEKFPLHHYLLEWSGYTQIFHADDLALGPPPWHQTDWRHAGGPDSFFQMKWSAICKLRPPFEVLHLGPAATNWMGRATPLADGSLPADAGAKQEALKQVWQRRAVARREGRDAYAEERLPRNG